MQIKDERKFEDNQLRMEIIDGVLYAYYKAGLNFNIEVSKSFVKERLKFLKGEKYPIVVFDEGIISMDKASRDYFASDEGIQGIKAVALVETTALSRMLIGFFLGMTKSKIEARAFTDPNEAVLWLKSL